MADKKKNCLMAVVTTDKDRRGVFFGEVVNHDILAGTCTLANAQMCLYWSKETKGILGLAATGPMQNSRVTPVVPLIELNGVTSVIEATAEANMKWREMPWD